ncbi:MAG: AAA family ATPase [Bacillota bacterium]
MAGLREIESYLQSRFFERAEVVRGALLALLAREHVLLLGPPGTAKSQLVNELAACLGLRYFSWLLTRFSTPEELFGAVSLRALQEDRYARVTAGKLPEAEVAFLDEVFKASSAILNTLLGVMNERVFFNDGQGTRVPLVSLFGASNEVPQGDDEAALQAFWARFLLRYQVQPLVEQSAFRAMLDLEEPDASSRPVLAREGLFRAQQEAAMVEVPSEVKDAVFALRKELADQGIRISDRQWRHSLKLLRANAFLDGRSRVDVAADFDVYCHICWTDPSQERTVVKTVRRVADPLAERVLELLEEAQEIYEGVMKRGGGDEKATTAAAVEANSKLRRILKELAAVASRGGPVAQAKAWEAHARVDELNRTMAHELLGIEL